MSKLLKFIRKTGYLLGAILIIPFVGIFFGVGMFIEWINKKIKGGKIK